MTNWKIWLRLSALLNIFLREKHLFRQDNIWNIQPLVVEGRIKLYRESEYGDEAFMYYLESKMPVLSMLYASRQKKPVRLLPKQLKTTIIMIPIQYTDELMKYHQDWYNFVIETYRSRFEEMLEVFDNVVFKAMDERLEAYLKTSLKACNQTGWNLPSGNS